MDAFDKSQADLNKEIEAHYERQKRLPVGMKVGPHGTLQTAAGATAREALGRIKFGRPYAFDGQSALEFGAEAMAAMQMKMNVVDVFDQMASTRYLAGATVIDGVPQENWKLPNWRQLWRPQSVEIPPLPVDPITGERVRNPWLEPHDFKSQNVIRTNSPRQARWLEDCAKNGGVTAAMLDALEAERIEAAQLLKLDYGQEAWMSNKLRQDLEPNVTLRGQFRKSIADPWKLHAHDAEQKLGAARALLNNLTFRMALAQKDPQLAAVHKAAGELLKEWQQAREAKAA